MKRHVILVVAVLLVVCGAAFLPLPGPGSLVLVGGLALLARESLWVARLLDRADKKAHEWWNALRQRWRRYQAGR